MIDRLKLPISFDAQFLRGDLKRLRNAAWLGHFVTQTYEGDWSVIPLRGPANATHPVMMMYSDPTCTQFANTPYLTDLRYIPLVLGSLHCRLFSARLMKLTAGSRIEEHRDLDLAAEHGTARLHVPIETIREVDFRLNGTRVPLKEGECWYLRLSDPHSVANRGATGRIHLIIDAEVNPWLRDLLGTGGRPVQRQSAETPT